MNLKEIEKEIKEDLKKEKQLNNKKKKEGYKYRVDYWVHNEGDDICKSFYTKVKPNKNFIVSHIKLTKSIIVDDYQIYKL